MSWRNGMSSGLDWTKGQGVSAKKLNRMVDLVSAASPAINLRNPQTVHPTGSTVEQIKEYMGTPVICKVTANRSPGGEYDVVILNGVASEATGSTFTTDDMEEGLPAILQNLGEAGTTDHTLAVDTVLTAQVVGRASDAEDGVLVLRTGGVASLPKGQYQYMVYQMVTQNQAGFDYVRAAPIIV